MDDQICNVCSRPFPLSAEFWHRHPRSSSGFGGTCKECAKQRTRLWNEANRERQRQNVRDYAARTRSPGSRRDEYIEGRERILEYQRRYYEQNAEKVKQRQREYIAENREKVAESKRLAHIDNREADNLRFQNWAAANPEAVRLCAMRMRARRRGAPGRFTQADVVAQYDRQRGACFYCHHSIAGRRFHLDHHIPLARGGSNEPSNIVLACPSCNRAKGAKLPSEFKPPKE